MTLKLYYAPGTVALACHIALAEAGADYQAIALDFSKHEQRGEAFLAINPKGRVPALITDRGVLTETPAILAFIAQSYPAARLAPLEDVFAFAELQSFTAYLSSTVHVATAHDRRASRWADQESSFADMRAKVPQNARDCCQLINAEYFDGPWVMGADYTIADPYLFTIVGWLGRYGIELNEFPKIAAHWQAMQARPAVRRALAEQAPA
ncbi:MAG: glutathione S-transferase N-terminal domain-containing protein [Beijerinckiaceae bacterium]|nr:glutathione S-transferase N-terminal domain-containing protein [Beijerinckiaceae bacterium]